jgi:hypothetical protein
LEKVFLSMVSSKPGSMVLFAGRSGCVLDAMRAKQSHHQVLLCPSCLKFAPYRVVEQRESMDIRGVSVSFDTRYLVCLSCEEEYDDPNSDFDEMDLAYREYRRLKGWLQPEDIRTLRTARGWTQEEMDRQVGWPERTTERYENGSLQTEEHERGMRNIICNKM